MIKISGFGRLCCLFLFLTACSHQVDPASEFRAYSRDHFETRLYGRYAVILDTGLSAESYSPEMKQSCWAHDYELRLSSNLDKTLASAAEAVVEHIEIVPEPLSESQLEANGYAGQIRIRSEKPVVNLELVAVQPGLPAAAKMYGMDVSLDGSIEVFTPQHPEFFKAFSVTGTSTKPFDVGCWGWDEYLGKAAQLAIEEFAREVALTLNAL